MFARQLPAVATTSSSLQIQYVQLAPWSCQIPARCFRVSHIIYMLTLCICFQTFFFLAYHVGNTGDAARRTLRFDEELHAPPAPNASVDGELVTYAPVRNITRWRRVWRHEARKFLREYEAACADGWPSPNGTNVTNTTSFPSPAGDMTVNVVELKSSKTVDRIAPLPLCACVPSGLKGQLGISVDGTPGAAELARVVQGGGWKPTGCRARQRVAIIVPYRDRQQHLELFVRHMHPILQRQMLEYRIFVVEQALPTVFNKAAMMNIGYRVARTVFDFDCVVFHDVDMLTEDDRNFYTCSDQPRHAGAYIDKYGYKLVYDDVFGGVTAFTNEQFLLVNGFSNLFYGWGGEDDDMLKRVLARGFTITRYPQTVARYKMIKHTGDQRNPYNFFGFMYNKYGIDQYEHDGVNSVEYAIHSVSNKSLYTWIYASIDTPLNNFTVYHGGCAENSLMLLEVPLVECACECDLHARCVAFVYSKVGCLLKIDTCQFTYSPDTQYLYVKKSFNGTPPIRLPGKQDTDVLEYYSAQLGECNLPALATHDLLLESCAMACAEDDRCVAFRHLNVSISWDTPAGLCVLQAAMCIKPKALPGAMTYTKGKVSVLGQYSRRRGSCIGGDIKGLKLSLVRCAHACNAIPECVGFVYAPSHQKTCWLKRQLCEHRKSVRGATLYVRWQSSNHMWWGLFALFILVLIVIVFRLFR
ncbi:Beta-1,4-N-acetylgalactosaminyltransferase bre-4 [Lamellibrachia satsuma]|nr:Beta-1,4-N-acetylgalactosaminyltransferase bre-4 [Lamellibrachia satsuma]